MTMTMNSGNSLYDYWYNGTEAYITRLENCGAGSSFRDRLAAIEADRNNPNIHNWHWGNPWENLIERLKELQTEVDYWFRVYLEAARARMEVEAAEEAAAEQGGAAQGAHQNSGWYPPYW